MRTVAVIQARMGSTRLPGKVLADVAGHPLIEHVIRRTQRSAHLDAVVLATTDKAEDRPVAYLARSLGALVVQGNVDDVLSRFCTAIDLTGADAIVRITGDCPFVDWKTIDRVIEAGSASGETYLSAGERAGYPRGLDSEYARASALLGLAASATTAAEREHVTLGLYRRPGTTVGVAPVPDRLRRPDLRLCVDEPADLELVRELHRRTGTGIFVPIEDVIAVLDAEPSLRALNAGVRQIVP